MTKKSKVLIALLIILLTLILYLILTSASVMRVKNFSQQAKPENSVLLEADYQPKVKAVFTAYGNLIKDNDFSAGKIAELKDKLLGLKVPAKFKDLHIRFILALIKAENYLNNKIEQEKSDSLKAVEQLKADYNWLNN